MTRKQLYFAAILFPALLSMGAPCLAQEVRATLSGTVTDSSGSAVPNAQVRLTNIETGTGFAAVSNEQGQYRFLFVNAGFYEVGTLGEITEEHFDKTFNTNVRGLLFAVQKALPLLSKGASVILTGSIASSIGIPSFSVYNATKAAVRSFARSWILDLKGRGIRVNVLSPGHISTPGLDVLLDQKAQADLVTKIPLDRIGTPDDIARAAVFLASDDSAYVTGVELMVDGGATGAPLGAPIFQDAIRPLGSEAKLAKAHAQGDPQDRSQEPLSQIRCTRPRSHLPLRLRRQVTRRAQVRSLRQQADFDE